MSDELDIEDKFIVGIIGVVFIVILFFILQPIALLGYLITKGEGQYSGQIVETQHHGIIFRTYGVQLKTEGFTPRFEDFCVIDKNVFEKIKSMPRNKSVTVSYVSKLSTPFWKCHISDSSDIITDVQLNEQKDKQNERP